MVFWVSRFIRGKRLPKEIPNVKPFLITKLECLRANGAKDASPEQRPGLRAYKLSSALKGRRIPAPSQGAPRRIDSETQGVALGWHPAALSAPGDVESSESESCDDRRANIFVSATSGDLIDTLKYNSQE